MPLYRQALFHSNQILYVRTYVRTCLFKNSTVPLDTCSLFLNDRYVFKTCLIETANVPICSYTIKQYTKLLYMCLLNKVNSEQK